MFEFPDMVTALDQVPEQFRPLYAADKDGSIKIKDTPEVKGAREAIVGLSKSLKAARQDADNFKKSKVDLTPLKEFGESPESILQTFQSKLSALQEELGKGTKAKADFDSLRADLQKAHKTEIEKYEARNKGLQGQLWTLLVETTAKSAIASQKGDLDLLMPFVKDRVKVVEEDGVVKTYVVGDQGERRYGAMGADMTITELIAEMKSSSKFSKLFESETPRGGGTPPGGPSSRPGPKSQDRNDMTATQKISAALGAKRR
jgi:predicted transcriptional regulator